MASRAETSASTEGAAWQANRPQRRFLAGVTDPPDRLTTQRLRLRAPPLLAGLLPGVAFTDFLV